MDLNSWTYRRNKRRKSNGNVWDLRARGAVQKALDALNLRWSDADTDAT